MPRAFRLLAGWSLALATAFLLNLAIVGPRSGQPARGGASPDPTTAARDLRQVSAARGLQAVELPRRIPHTAIAAVGPDRPLELARLPRTVSRALAAATQRERLAFGLYSLTFGVSVDGRRRWTGGSGWAADDGWKPDGDTPYVVASITKTYTASIVLELVEEGRLSLGDRVVDLVPGIPVNPEVTVGQLLHHTSGIADLYHPLRDALNANEARRWTPLEVLSGVGGPWFQPGAGFAYSNTNYILLGMIVERITGRSFAAELRSRITGPLDLDATALQGRRHHVPYLLATSWATAFWTSGAIYSTAEDLLRWGDALYGGNVLSRASLHRMLHFTKDRYGLGAERLRVGEEEGYGHSGLLRGYTSLLIRIPERRVTMVVLAIGQQFDPAVLLADDRAGGPSLLDLALRSAPRS